MYHLFDINKYTCTYDILDKPTWQDVYFLNKSSIFWFFPYTYRVEKCISATYASIAYMYV